MYRCANVFILAALYNALPGGLVAGLLMTVPAMAHTNPQAAPIGPPAGALETFATPRGSFGWYVVNDNVMGGRSQGGYAVDAGALAFRGSTNTNGGGFSSLRTDALDLDLSQADGVALDVVGDGRRYTWRLTTDATWRGRQVAYWASFDTIAGTPQTVKIPFERFVPRFRGARLSGPPLNRARITGMGIMIYDGDDGPFALSLREVGTYVNAFSLAAYRGSHRVLVLEAPSMEHPAADQQLADIAATRTAFAERDLLLIVLTPDGSLPRCYRALTADQRDELRRQLDLNPGQFGLRLVGKDGSLKRRESSPVAMEQIYGLIDGMPMRRREIRERSGLSDAIR